MARVIFLDMRQDYRRVTMADQRPCLGLLIIAFHSRRRRAIALPRRRSFRCCRRPALGTTVIAQGVLAPCRAGSHE